MYFSIKYRVCGLTDIDPVLPFIMQPQFHKTKVLLAGSRGQLHVAHWKSVLTLSFVRCNKYESGANHCLVVWFQEICWHFWKFDFVFKEKQNVATMLQQCCNIVSTTNVADISGFCLQRKAKCCNNVLQCIQWVLYKCCEFTSFVPRWKFIGYVLVSGVDITGQVMNLLDVAEINTVC